MNKMNIDVMDKKYKNIYSLFERNIKESNIDVVNTPWRGKESKNSYCFNIPSLPKNNEAKIEAIGEYLKKVFDIKETASFDRAIKQVCSGSGKEAEKITVLRSSSLCGLLNFYNVSEKPVSINVGSNKTIKFNKAYFEVKNKVITADSNVDIVLVSEDNMSVLFLESKFAEYYIGNGIREISAKYLDDKISKQIYKDDILKRFDFKISEKNNDYFKVDSEKSKNTKSKSYVEGIKQMICHYIGINNFLENKPYYLKELELDDNVQIYLGEILFDFDENTEMNKYLEDYKEKYKVLVPLLKQNERIHMIPEVLEYSNFNTRLNEKIQRFYKNY